MGKLRATKVTASCLSSLASGVLSHPNYSLSTAVELQAHNATHNPFIVAPHQSVPVTVGVHRFLLTFVGRVTWATSSPEVAGTLRACLTAHVVYCVEDSILTAVKLLHTKTWQASEEHSSECLQEFHLAGLQGVGTRRHGGWSNLGASHLCGSSKHGLRTCMWTLCSGLRTLSGRLCDTADSNSSLHGRSLGGPAACVLARQRQRVQSTE